MSLIVLCPAAALPFWWLCKRGTLHFPSLVAGLLTAQFWFFLGGDALARRAAEPMGGALLLPPSAALLLFAFYALRKPLLFSAPNPHRYHLSRCRCIRFAPVREREFFASILSLVLGSAIGWLWLSVTSSGGWLTKRVPLLQKEVWIPWMSMDGTFPVWWLLNALSAALAALALGSVYFWWLARRKKSVPHPYSDREFELWRKFFWFVIPGLALSLALADSTSLLGQSPNFAHYALFASKLSKLFVFYGAPAALSGSLLIYWTHQRRMQKALAGR